MGREGLGGGEESGASGEVERCPARLLDHGLDDVAILHIETFGSVIMSDPRAVVDKSAGVFLGALLLEEDFHHFLELGRRLESEEKLGAIGAAHFYIHLLGGRCLAVHGFFLLLF